MCLQCCWRYAIAFFKLLRHLQCAERLRVQAVQSLFLQFRPKQQHYSTAHGTGRRALWCAGLCDLSRLTHHQRRSGYVLGHQRNILLDITQSASCCTQACAARVSVRVVCGLRYDCRSLPGAQQCFTNKLWLTAVKQRTCTLLYESGSMLNLQSYVTILQSHNTLSSAKYRSSLITDTTHIV